MERILNNSVMPLVNSGNINMLKINQLILLKEFIDRNSANSYLSEDCISDITQKYGTPPDVQTWGDFFQSEVAQDAYSYDDEEFMKTITTIKFDIMSAYEIFSEQKFEFFDWIEKNFADIVNNDTDDYTEEEKEILHLKILKDYYINMGLKNSFTPEEILWYGSFSEEDDQQVV